MFLNIGHYTKFLIGLQRLSLLIGKGIRRKMLPSSGWVFSSILAFLITNVDCVWLQLTARLAFFLSMSWSSTKAIWACATFPINAISAAISKSWGLIIVRIITCSCDTHGNSNKYEAGQSWLNLNQWETKIFDNDNDLSWVQLCYCFTFSRKYSNIPIGSLVRITRKAEQSEIKT